MLGEQYAELRGKITGQRVLDVEGPTIETSVTVSGTMKGVPVQEMITFIGTPTTEKGVIHGVGKGVVMALGDGVEGGEPEMVSYTGEGIGRLSTGGSIKWLALFSIESSIIPEFQVKEEENCHFSITWLDSLKLR